MANVYPSIYLYKFDASKDAAKTVLAFSALMPLFFAVGTTPFFSQPYVWCSLFSAVMIAVNLFYFKWEKHGLNLVVTISYFVLSLVEVLLWGFPGGGEMVAGGPTAKGAFFDVIVNMFPYAYTGLRVLLVAFLIMPSYRWLAYVKVLNTETGAEPS